MIYSTNYKELYRRVMQGESVLAIYLSSGDPCIVSLIEGVPHLYIAFNTPSSAMLGHEKFADRCKSFNLRFVPDNEPDEDLIDEAVEDVITICNLNTRIIAKELIKKGFYVINKQDINDND